MQQSYSDVSSKALLKRFAQIYLPIVIVLSIILITSIRFEKQSELNRLESIERNRIEIAKAHITQDFEGVDSDLRVISNLPLLKSYFDNSSPAKLDELANYFQLLSREKRQYNVVRFVDTGGQEVVRINFNNGSPAIVTHAELQNKFKRYYFNDTFRLNSGDVYVSPFDLGIENNRLVIPFMPTIRFGTPVFDNAGRKKGVLLFDYLGSNLLQSFHNVMQGTGHIGMLLNRDGYWLGSANHADEWGFMKMLGKSDRTFGHDFPAEWDPISKGAEGSLLTDKGVFVYSTIRPLLLGEQSSSGSDTVFGVSQQEFNSSEYYWKIVSFTPYEVLSGSYFYNQTNNRLLIVMGYLFFALASLIVARTTLGRKQVEAEIRIAATAFESNEGMLVTDADSIIIRVNDAFTDITGFTSEDVIGKTPHLLRSGQHDSAFYTTMWESINRTGSWEGEIWNKRKNSEIYPVYLTITAVKNKEGEITNYVATLTDITMSKKAADEIKNLAFYDPLTQLPNRRLLQDRLFQALSSSERSGQAGAILFIDLDNFKIINDTLGHARGDRLLQEVAERLKSCVREGDTVARLGGDEFVLVLENLSKQPIESAAQAEAVAKKILASLNEPYYLGKKDYFNSPSIGITLFNGHKISSDELFKQADIAMYQAKDDGRNTIRFFDPHMQTEILVRSRLESELRTAVECRQFFLYYQIQMDYLQNPIGAEALIRWVHPTRNIVSPAEFIPIAEEAGLIVPIGKWVLNAACLQLSKWQLNPTTCDLILSVNVSAKQFRQVGFADEVKEIVVRCGINPTRLKLELTESILLNNIQDIIETMNAISVLGVRFSLDDFGTGYSSLQYLKQLPLHQLKIDQSFVRDLAVDNSDKAIVDTVISMAHSLNLDVIAEGVETEEQRLYLENAGCPNYQGYLFSKPVPLQEFEALVQKYHDENLLYSQTSIQTIGAPPPIESVHPTTPFVDSTNESLEIFTWNESFSTGIPQIDEQHKQLVHLINLLARSIASKAGMPVLDEIFNDLADYAVYHFKTEESIWHEYLEGDALEASHNLVHKGFISEVLRLKEADGTKTQNEVVENILSFLTNWLAFHILDSDKRMAMVVVAMQSGMTLEKAKQHVTRRSSGSIRALIGANLSMYNQLSRRTLQLMKEVNERKLLEEHLLQIEQPKKSLQNES